MEARDFVYWLQGALEVGEPETIEAKQFEIIRRHLDLAFYYDIEKGVLPKGAKAIPVKKDDVVEDDDNASFGRPRC